MGLLLLILSIVLSVILLPVGWIYSLVTLRLKWSKLNAYAKNIALSIDQLGNVVLSNIMNDFLIKGEGYDFGNEDETISKVLGKNKETNTLTKLGKWISKILNKIDPNHVEKASRSLD
tara:strand:- start:13337 stop:13690 length:354 start_codon:yes stop_codon:yes gene_type:complete